MTVEALSEAMTFGDALVATPSLWRYLVAQGLVAPANAMAVSFGEALTPELSAAIRKAGFGAQREVYGSTETGLIAWRDAPGEPFALLDQWKRDGDELLRISPSGESIKVSSMDLLRWDGERTTAAFGPSCWYPCALLGNKAARRGRLTALPVWARTLGKCPVDKQYCFRIRSQLKPEFKLTYQGYLQDLLG